MAKRKGYSGVGRRGPPEQEFGKTTHWVPEAMTDTLVVTCAFSANMLHRKLDPRLQRGNRQQEAGPCPGPEAPTEVPSGWSQDLGGVREAGQSLTMQGQCWCRHPSAGSETQGWSRRARGQSSICPQGPHPNVQGREGHSAGPCSEHTALRFEEGALATHIPSAGFPSQAWRPRVMHACPGRSPCCHSGPARCWG